MEEGGLSGADTCHSLRKRRQQNLYPRYHWGCCGMLNPGSRGPTLTNLWAGDVVGVEYVGEVGELPPSVEEVDGGLLSTGRGTGRAMGGGGGGGSIGVGKNGLWTFPWELPFGCVAPPSGHTSWTNSLSVSWGWYRMAGWEKYEPGCCRMGEDEKCRPAGGACGLACREMKELVKEPRSLYPAGSTSCQLLPWEPLPGDRPCPL